ncbi:MetS family NSS transporter small subunit [Pseudalkalibacillus berkeleyi]|uniref:MetS family NSS transporter small subunit n=1 Tax=Pseudalkalibacillus berkeleyi TaxID=1069813 RepID=A0ABS9H0T1_9BACL|nr:MetS family NSS transporter small subunit [Pseudalkalibacillus berkeleyi]MCF6138549.1 MetS family NSS transporter small subunit [Pseudalkalibacillus berkeleyi]
MTGSAIAMFVVGAVIIWGGLALSIGNAIKVAKQNKE